MSSFITPEARISYPNLFTPSAPAKGAEAVYSAQLVFEEDTDLSELKRTILDALAEEHGEDEIFNDSEIRQVEASWGVDNYLVTSGGLRIRLPWRDDPEVVATKGYPEGSTFINVKSKNPVPVVSQIPDPSNDGKPAQVTNLNGDVRYADGTVLSGAVPIYPGRIVQASINPFVYTQPNHGVSLWFASGIQVLGDADRLDNRQKAEDTFAADADAVPDLSDVVEEETAGVGAGEDGLDDLIG